MVVFLFSYFPFAYCEFAIYDEPMDPDTGLTHKVLAHSLLTADWWQP